MSLRSDIVDDLFLQSSITDIVGRQIFGIFNEFEDFLNSKANFGGFPAVVVKSNSHVKAKAINCNPLNLINESLEVTALVQINQQNIKARSNTVRSEERDNMRVLDTLTDALETYFDLLTGSTKTNSRVLRSHLVDIAEVEIETEGNRKIIGKDILIDLTWQKVTETIPVNTVLPTITGDTGVDDILTASTGTWSGENLVYTYQWYRDGSPIALATNPTYTIVGDDQDTVITVVVTATNGEGSDDAESAGLAIPSGEITRNFTELSSAGSQRFTTPPVTLASDWGIEIDFQDSGGAFATILGSQLSNGDLQITQVSWGAVGGRSNIAVYLSGANEYWPVSSHTTAGVLHTLKVTLTGSTVELFIDGLSLGTKIMTPFTDPVSFLIGANSSLSWLSNGYLANFKITDSGTLVRSYAIDEDWSGGSTVLVDSIGGQNGTAVNITDADAEEFTLNEDTDPDQWENVGATIIIPVAS